MNDANFNNQSSNAQNAPQVKVKGRKPDIEFHHVTEEDGQTVWEQVGAVWKGSKDGYFTGTINGQKIVGQTREAKEALMAMRKQQQATPEKNPTPQPQH